MAFIGYFATSGNVQTALNEEKLFNPYVAYVEDDDRIDYNSLEPSPVVNYKGVWSDDGEGTYTFEILDTDTSNWGGEDIGTFMNISYANGTKEIIVNLSYDIMEDYWNIRMTGEHISDEWSNQFVPGSDDEQSTGLYTVDMSSDAEVMISYDGSYTFSFFTVDSNNPLIMTTTNPEER